MNGLKLVILKESVRSDELNVDIQPTIRGQTLD